MSFSGTPDLRPDLTVCSPRFEMPTFRDSEYCIGLFFTEKGNAVGFFRKFIHTQQPDEFYDDHWHVH